MEQYGFVFLLAVLCVTQTSAVKIGDSFVQNIITDLNNLKEEAKQQLAEIQETYKSNLESFRTNLNVYTDKSINNAVISLASKKCDPGTELELRGLKDTVFGQFIACINFTKTIANFEKLGYDFFVFAEHIENTTAQFLSSVSVCYGYSFFKAASCVVSTVQTYTANFTETTTELNVFINRTETLTSDIVSEFKTCLFGSQTYATNAVNTVLKKKCQS